MFKNFRKVTLRHLLPDIFLMIASLYLSLYLRIGENSRFTDYLHILQVYIPIFVSLRVLTFIALDIYSMMWRYVSADDAMRIFRAVMLSSVLVISVAFLVPSLGHLPRSLFLIDSILLTLLLMGIRILRRLIYERRHRRAGRVGEGSSSPTIIIGAGSHGRILAQKFRGDPSLNIDLLGFLDDDLKKHGKLISGYKVLDETSTLAIYIEKHKVRRVIVAMTDVPSDLLRQIFVVTRRFNIVPQMTTNLKENSFRSEGTYEIFREVNLGDLLRRPGRQIDLGSIRNMIKGKRVLISGAGGSIGSELARQILALEPSRLLLVDHSELNLYQIDKDLRLSTHDVGQVVPLLTDIKDVTSVELIFKEYMPEIVFHAAAYKHVHLVETNPYSAILNNVLGTRNLLDAAISCGVERFINVSTDKAVNPAGVMGASKRVCEILTTLSAVASGRQYCSVRFGNVLGSSGSLIPNLKEQIKKGGPITLTHQEMTRYFMLIPEAVALVLKAATIARPGDINVLKMGEPVKIIDIAKSLITLMGRTDKEIPIMFTGLRPGEKMFEELYIRGDELSTEHPDVLTIPNGDFAAPLSLSDRTQKKMLIDKMIGFAQLGNKESIFILNQIVNSNYTPGPDETYDGEQVIATLHKYRRDS